MEPKIIFVHPPVVKPSEPPAGIGRLSAYLQANGVFHEVIDANWEGLLYLMKACAKDNRSVGRWDTRVRKHLHTNIAALQSIGTFHNQSRYSRAVLDINRLLHLAGKKYDSNLTLADYTHERLSPV
jgi:hypothetical protein